MKRYMLFSGSSFYADGGAIDLINDFDTLEECEMVWDYINDGVTGAYEEYSWAHVLDVETKEIKFIKIGDYCGRPNNWYEYEE